MKTKKLIISALFIAIATILSMIKMFALPFGGAITPASMLPIVLLSYIYGVKWGLFCGGIYSILQMITGMSTVSALFLPGESQMIVWKAISVCLMDYVFSYTVLGFGGIFRKKIKNNVLSLCIGTAFAMLLSYIMHILSGAVFYRAWAEWFFTQEGFYSFGKKILDNCNENTVVWLYTTIYNGLYMIPEIIITTIVAPIVYLPIKKSKKNLNV